MYRGSKSLWLLLCLATHLSCLAPLDLSELNQDAVENLEPLKLVVGYELEELRIDIVRQQESIMVDDMESMVADPYHPVGFHLGNGLFIDLNDNLCLLPRTILEKASSDHVPIKVTGNVQYGTRIRIKEIADDWICEVRETGMDRELRKCLEITRKQDGFTVNKGARALYSIYGENDTIIYRKGERRQSTILVTSNVGKKYKVKRGRREKHYGLEGDSLILGEKYLIKSYPASNKWEIIKHSRRRSSLLYTLKKGADGIYIYDASQHGYKIVLSAASMLVYKNQKPLIRAERMHDAN